MTKALKKALLIICGLLLVIPQLTLADGMIMPPPNYWVQETGQKAVIFYDEGVETMVVSITFQGDAEDFGWVVPVPAQPTVTKGSDGLFTSLQELTGYYPYNRYDTLSVGATLDETQNKGVTVIETKKIDYYDVTVLSADDRDALTDWLSDHDYNFPSSASYILDSYIQNNWYFVAMRIDVSSLDWTDVSQQLRTGHATPVSIAFETENIVYPLKISSVTSRPDQNKKPSYDTGAVGKAIEINRNSLLSLDSFDGFTTDSGTVEAWVQPDATWENSTGYWEIMNVVDSNAADIFEFRIARSYDDESVYLQYVAYDENYRYQLWQAELPNQEWQTDTWYQLAVTWSDENSPIGYVNGQAYPMTSVSGNAQWAMRSAVGATLYLGQRGNQSENSALRGTLDEARIVSTTMSGDEMQESYTTVREGTAHGVSDETVFLSHFDSSLAEAVSGRELNYTVSTYDQSSEYASLELYVFADHKKALPGFSTSWANWLKDDAIEELALDDQGNPWITPDESKYFLTKLTRTMAYTEMTEDLFFRQADDNSKVGVGPSRWDRTKRDMLPVLFYGMLFFVIILFISVLSPFGMLFIIMSVLIFLVKKRSLRVLFWIIQAGAAFLYLLMLSAILFVPISGQSFWGNLGDMPFNSLTSSTRSMLGIFMVLIPIAVVLVVMAGTMILQVRYQRRKRMLQAGSNATKETPLKADTAKNVQPISATQKKTPVAKTKKATMKKSTRTKK